MGGGAMRTAAKIADFLHNGGLRGAPLVPRPEQAATTASRNVSSSVSAAIKDRKSDILVSSQNRDIASVQRPSWELAGDDEMHPMPRVIFGGAPTLEEAKEEIANLQDVLENATGCRNSSATVQEYVPRYSESKACVTSEMLMAFPSMPNHVFQAFSWLKENPVAQAVVASLASDKNVFNAVLQNEEVVEFLKLQQTRVLAPTMDMNVNEPFADDECHDDQKSSNKNVFNAVMQNEKVKEVFKFLQTSGALALTMVMNAKVRFADDECHDDQKSYKSFDDGTDGKSSEGIRNVFMHFVQKVKLKMTEMLSNLPEFFPVFFGARADAGGNTPAYNVDRTFGSYFMTLALMVIMVVLLKRI